MNLKQNPVQVELQNQTFGPENKCFFQICLQSVGYIIWSQYV